MAGRSRDRLPMTADEAEAATLQHPRGSRLVRGKQLERLQGRIARIPIWKHLWPGAD